jgi:hypothetical protein
MEIDICTKCGYEINGKTEDYAPVCSPTTEIPQCNECIICLLYCDCEIVEVTQEQLDKTEDNIEELKGELQMALDLQKELKGG